jgi:hypothetical protein
MSHEKLKQHMAALIAQRGMAVNPVMGNPPFAYSIGQHAKGLPELIVFGIPPAFAAHLLHQIGAHLAAEQAAGRTVGPGTVHLEGYPLPTALIEVPVDAARQYATVADEFSNGQATYLQAVWPDQAGLYPWQRGFDERYRDEQLMLGTPLEGTAGPRVLH